MAGHLGVAEGPFVDGLWTVSLKSASEPRKSWISGYRGQDGAGYITSCPERQRTRTVRSVLAVTTKRRVLAPGGRDREGERFLRAFRFRASRRRSPGGAGVPEAPGSRTPPPDPMRAAGWRDPWRSCIVGGAAASPDPTWSRWSADRPHQRLHRPAAWMGCGWTLAFRLRYMKLVDKALPELMPPEVMLVLSRGAVNNWRSGRCLHRSQSRRVLASGAMERPGIKVSLGVFVCPDPGPGASLAAGGRTASAPAPRSDALEPGAMGWISLGRSAAAQWSAAGAVD